ncbi:MAG: HlyD family type I secretion periplasmic adaptor subunit [Rickettsiales bacterium]|jgi:HlyD family type I secretion membrane fusion protein|nr:HlyD family type I secretion periplasmic adaptor subunit [Rickettsiales bacterium]
MHLNKKLQITQIKNKLTNKFSFCLQKLKTKLTELSNYISVIADKYIIFDDTNIGAKPIKYGLYSLGIFSFVFFIWGGLMPISSSSIASGKIVLDFNTKTIQHFEGGIIEKIMVKEGQDVVTGTDLVILQNIQAKAQQAAVQKQLFSAKAIYQRLVAEQNYNQDLDLSALVMLAKSRGYSKGVIESIETQENIFKIKKASYLGRVQILEQRIIQIRQEIIALKSQKNSVEKQLVILSDQLTMTKKMVQLRNLPITDQLELEKQIADLEGKNGSFSASIAKTKQTILETELEIINLSKENLNNILAEMQETEKNISNLQEQLTSTSDVLKRTVIKAPSSGLIMNLQFHTIGAVIPPGGAIMSIVPQDEELIIEARIKPQDIDVVKQGLKAKINLSAFKAKKVPKLEGEIITISADILLDEITGEQYFLSRIKISEESLSKIKTDVTLYPGMPVDVFIITGSRTLLQYLVSPISDAAYKAFRED